MTHMGQNDQQGGQADRNPNETPASRNSRICSVASPGQDNDQDQGNQAGRDDENRQNC